MVSRLHVATTNRFVDWPQQRLNPLQSADDRAGRQVQSVQTKLFDRPLDRPLAVELFQQQMHPQACAQAAFGNQFRRLRSGHRSSAGAIASFLIALPPQPTAKNIDLDLQLLGVFGPGMFGQRLSATTADALLRRQLYRFLADRKLRIVSAPRAGSIRLLSPFLL